MLDNDLEDEIVIGINRPKVKKKFKNKKVAKKATSQNTKKVDKIHSKKKKETKKKIKKNKQKMNKKMLITFLIIAIFIGLIIFILNFPYFKITNIELKNNSKVTEEEIKEIAKFEEYKNMFWINTKKIEKEIKNNNAYVEEINISRKLPNTAVIMLKERVPKYMLQFADSYVYINNQGYMLEVSTENINLPIILGFKTDLSNIEVRK